VGNRTLSIQKEDTYSKVGSRKSSLEDTAQIKDKLKSK
jgi:hypothetical protein